MAPLCSQALLTKGSIQNPGQVSTEPCHCSSQHVLSLLKNV